jgi:hypothetical protein
MDAVVLTAQSASQHGYSRVSGWFDLKAPMSTREAIEQVHENAKMLQGRSHSNLRASMGSSMEAFLAG